MVVRTTSSMGMLKLSSRLRGKTGLLLGSRIVLPLSILPLTVFNLLLLPFNHESSIYQLLVVVEGCYHQLHAQLIIQSFQKLLLLSCIRSNVIWGIPASLLKSSTYWPTVRPPWRKLRNSRFFMAIAPAETWAVRKAC